MGLGANLGEQPARTVGDAAAMLRSLLVDARVAPLYRSRPLGPPQPAFFNTAVTGRTALSPPDLLAVVKRLELAAGRRPAARNSPRPLDIDLLLYDQEIVATPELSLPHPRLRERRFVLAPLSDIAPDWPVPPDGRSVAELLAALGDEQLVERLE